MNSVPKLPTLALAIALISQFNLHSQTPLWTFPTTQPVLTSPVIGPDGAVHVVSYDRNVYALNPDGSEKWTFGLPEPTYIYFDSIYTAAYGTPAFGNGALYVPSENGKVLALNSTNGALIWEFDTLGGLDPTNRQGLYSSVAIGGDGSIYFGSYNSNLYSLNPNGTLKWAAPLGSTIFASPVVGRDGTVYCGSDDGKFHALNSTNGTSFWAIATGTQPIAASPAIDASGNLYIGVNSAINPTFYSISSSGNTNWVFTAGGAINSSAAIGADGTIYFGCDDNKLYALAPNGTNKWTFTAGAAIGSSPAIAADGTIYFGCDDYKLYKVDTNGNLLGTFETVDKISASPAIGPDGTVYFASEDGSLYLIRGCQPPVISDWPMFRHDAQRTGRASLPWTNTPPFLPFIADQTIAGGSPLSITNLAIDADTPAQQLVYSLAPGAPAGATINATNGIFSWTPIGEYVPSTNVFTVAVADSGAPSLSAVQCFTVAVTTPHPLIHSIAVSGGGVNLIWQAVPQKIYRIDYKTNLLDPEWLELTNNVTAASVLTTNSDLGGAGGRSRFYRIELLP